MPDKRDRKDSRIPLALVWIAGLAVAMRGLTWLRTDPVAFDSGLYFEMAALMGQGRWAGALAYPYPPLFPALVAAGQFLGLSAETAGLLIALVADLLVLLPLVGIARAVAGEATAWGAALLWAIHPYAVRLGVQALTDAPTALFAAGAIWAGLRALDTDRLAWGVGAGAACGVAYLFRPEGLEPVLALAALYAVRPPPATQPAGKPSAVRGALRTTAWTVAPLTGWALVALPYVASISLEAGSLTVSKKKNPAAMVGALAAPGSAQPTVVSRQPQSAAPNPQPTPSNPSPLRKIASNVYVFQRPLVNGIHPLVLCFAAMGAWRLRSRGGASGRRARALLGGLLGLHLTVLVALAASQGPGYLGGHHFFLAALYVLPLAGAGLAWMLAWGRDRLGARWLPAGAIVLLVATIAPLSVFRAPGRGPAIRPAAAWIRAQGPGTPVVVTHLAKLTYHAGAERVDLLGDYDETLRRARARAAGFVAFYPDMVRERWPGFLARLDPADLDLARVFPEPAGSGVTHSLEVYRIKPR